MSLTFVTRGYVNAGSTPLRFTHWGYLYRQPVTEPSPDTVPISTSTSVTSRRKAPVTDPVLRDDAELLQFIELFVKHKILK